MVLIALPGSLLDQETWQEPVAPPTADVFDPVYQFRVDGGVWVSNWDFTAFVSNQKFEVEGDLLGTGLIGIDVRQRAFSFDFGYETAQSSDMLISSVYGVGGYHLAVGGFLIDEIVFKAGGHYSTVRVNDFPGSFDPDLGFRGGMELRKAISSLWSLHTDVQYRFLQFDYDRGSQVSISDGRLGDGEGWALSIGIDYRF